MVKSKKKSEESGRLPGGIEVTDEMIVEVEKKEKIRRIKYFMSERLYPIVLVVVFVILYFFKPKWFAIIFFGGFLFIIIGGLIAVYLGFIICSAVKAKEECGPGIDGWVAAILTAIGIATLIGFWILQGLGTDKRILP